uniref:EGF-like domain-containing protein n=2 Tax=Magallana gigas TaxID=29159 RepID=A0A8W8MIS0_MAGGI
MPFLQIIFIFQILLLLGHFCSGIPEERGIILGVINPLSIKVFKEIPKSQASSFRNASHEITPSYLHLYSVASNPKEATVFVAIFDTIYFYSNVSISEKKDGRLTILFKGKSAAFGQIAIDYLSNNVYWCDSLLKWIAMKPANNFNNTIYKIIVHKDLNQPEGLALDLQNRIEKASLDGEDRVTIVYKGLSRVLSLTVDTANKKLYWADVQRHTIEGSSYDGSNRRVIRRLNLWSVTGVAYHQSLLHAVSIEPGKMFALDITSGSMLYSRTLEPIQPVTVSVYDIDSEVSFYNPCSTLICHHMCVNTASGPQCLCSEGFHLDNNGKTCTETSPFFKRGFIVNNATMFAMHEIHSANGQSSEYVYVHIPSSIIESFAVDAELDIIFFLDRENNFLMEHNIKSRQNRMLTSVSSAKDLNFDWIANIIGWIESKESSIRSFSVNSQITDTIYANLQNPAFLTIDPHFGYIYWISGKLGRSIVRGSWARDVPRVVISVEYLNDPISLKYDVVSNRLYWLDRAILKSSTATGLDIKSHVIIKGATNVFVYKDRFGLMKGDKLYFLRRIGNVTENVIKTIKNAKNVVVFDASLQKDKRGTCNILNGGCGEICIPKSREDGSICKCDVGLKLQPDQSCDSDVLQSDFIAVTDNSHGRILQIDLKNGTVVKLPLSVKKPTGLAFDKSTMTFFYSDASEKAILSATLHGKNKKIFYATGSSYALCLAIDYSTGNLYYTATGETQYQNYIGVVNRATSIHKTLITNLISPRDIALYSSKGYLFWTETGNRTTISRTHMDGSSKRYIATTGIELPNSITIDYSSSRLYWSDGRKDHIESSDLDGGNRQVLGTDSRAFINDIAIHGQYIFYTAWQREFITKMDKITGSKIPFMSEHPEFGRLDSLYIYTDENRDVSLSCSINNGLCSTFCFPTPNGRTCGCQDNVNLQSDQLTCEGVFRCQTLQQNLTFIDCLLPYPGLSCHFKCNTGYEPTVSTTVCGSEGQWMPPTDTLCKEIRKTETTYTYLYVASATGAFVAVMVTIGIICLVKRQSRSRESHDGTSSNAVNNQYISYDSQGYLHPGTKNHYHSIVSVYNIIHDEDLDDESVTNPYLTPVYEA